MSVADVATERIRELIISGELEPGQRLPSEHHLADQLGVSRSSLREAIRGLSQAQILEVRRGDGTYVSSLGPEQLIGGLGAMWSLMRDATLLEAFEVRRLLEPAATALAAQRVTDEQVEVLRTSLRDMRNARDVEELISLDVDFHYQVVASTGNATLCCLAEALAGRSLRARIWRGLAEGGVRAFTLEQHGRIVEALASRDPALASAASAIHVSASEEWLRKALQHRQEGTAPTGLLESADEAGVPPDELHS